MKMKVKERLTISEPRRRYLDGDLTVTLGPLELLDTLLHDLLV